MSKASGWSGFSPDNARMQRVLPGWPWGLYDTAAIRRIEQSAAAALPAHALMQRAGLAVARLALAIAPHAREIWIACDPGNNGGDGFEAAMHLRQWGKACTVTWLGDESRMPPDAAASLARARSAGVAFADRAPTSRRIATWDGCSSASRELAAVRLSLRQRDEIVVGVGEYHLARPPLALLDAPLRHDGVTELGEGTVEVVDMDVEATGEARVARPRRLTREELDHRAVTRDLAPASARVVAAPAHREAGG